jgi:RNA polymerase sigma-70 factor (ECF subfamily)
MPIAETDTVSNLLLRARGGDQDALERLFEVCRNYVNLLAQAQTESWLQAKVDASDIAQQTMLEAYRDFIGFEGRTNAEWLAWLRRILARNVTDFVRQFRGAKRQINREIGLHKQNTPSSSDNFFEPADSAETPSQQLLARERELLVADAVARLSPDHREVIMLRNLQQLEFEEVARRMNRSRPAVQMLWMRALAKLQELLPVEC